MAWLVSYLFFISSNLLLSSLRTLALVRCSNQSAYGGLLTFSIESQLLVAAPPQPETVLPAAGDVRHPDLV